MSAKPKRRKFWTKREEQRLRAIYPLLHQWETAKLLGCTKSQVANRAHKLGIKTEKWWTPKDLEKLRELYPHRSSVEVAKILGVSLARVYSGAARLKLRKTQAYLDSPAACRLRRGDNVGWAHRFPKGHVPANKGLHRPGYSIGRGRMQETQFKKGQKGHNWLPVGTVKLNPDGYLIRKIADEPVSVAGRGAVSKNWEFVHRRVWEDARGPIPKGRRIWWKDGNHENCALENLELLSDKEHMARTSIHKLLPPELASTILKVAWFKRKIRKIEEASREQNKKQDVGPAQSSVRGARKAERHRGHQRAENGHGAGSRESHRGDRAGGHQFRQGGSRIPESDRPAKRERIPGRA